MKHHTYANLILNWAVTTFGPVALDPVERSARIVEEAVEVAQADGVPVAMLHAIIERAYSRPKDTVAKELGGLLVTVYACAALSDLDPQLLLSGEVDRVLSKPREHWAAKHDAKMVDGTVTGPTTGGQVKHTTSGPTHPYCDCENRRTEPGGLYCLNCAGVLA